MIYDPRYLCPQCGRAPLLSERPDINPALLRRWMDTHDDNGGRLVAGSRWRCINGHDWKVPADKPNEPDAVPAAARA